MTLLVNFSGKSFEESRLRLNTSAIKYGIDKVFSYDEEYIKKTAFYRDHKSIFKYEKGLGYWLWKPFLILETLKCGNEGDIVIYSDAGIEIIDDISPLISLCNEHNIVLFSNGNLKNKFWVKRDCFVLMEVEEKKFWNGPQVDAAFCMFKNNVHTRGFVMEWLSYCTDERILSDSGNVMGKKNFFGFHFHRHDQSVLSLLAIKQGLTLFRQPTQFGNHYKIREYRVKGEFNCVNQFKIRQVQYYSSQPFQNSHYFQLLDHHRKKKESQVKERLSIPRLIYQSGKRRIKKIIKLLTRQ
jgi:hypothetical protein